MIYPESMFSMTLSPATPGAARPLRFIRRGEPVVLAGVPPERTLLELLREDLGCTGTKEGCGEGDCGACTVVLGEADNGTIRYRAINSCIRLAHSIDGMALWTVEDIAQPDGTLHPAQQAMVDHHASQCGFCTPGFVMSLFGLYMVAPTLPTACSSLPPEGAAAPAVRQSRPCGPDLQETDAPALAAASGSLPLQGATPPEAAHLPAVQARAGGLGVAAFSPEGAAAPAVWQSQSRGPGLQGAASSPVACTAPNPISREMAQEALSGNLCRCTGYRPILDAAQAMGSLAPVYIDEAGLLLKLEQLAQTEPAPEADLAYMLPHTLAGLLQARAAHPAAQLVAGCTDVGLWVTKQHRQFATVLDVTRVAELRRIEQHPGHIAIGAAVTLADAFAALVRQWPQLHGFAARFAGLPVRNSGTLGGNVANGSPIGDSMPLLIALGAQIVLMSKRGRREMPLEALYTGYRQNVMAPDEVLAFIKVPKSEGPHPRFLPNEKGVETGAKGASEAIPGLAPSPMKPENQAQRPPELLKVYKISKRYDDDISAVCLAVNLRIDNGVVAQASIGAGGVAATPARAVKTEAALTGQPWTLQTVQAAMVALRAEFTPLSDMRASSGYRTEVLGNLLQRYWLESQGMRQINLASFVLEEGT
ncbi:MAG: molybdopterin dehydrogenase, FAD-binding protein [Polaromonas sp.]|nr:molybdopterin dehydrogenase, FAD-binding protein [Polaromonas sp.]